MNHVSATCHNEDINLSEVKSSSELVLLEVNSKLHQQSLTAPSSSQLTRLLTAQLNELTS